MYMLGNHSLVVDSARRAIAEAERCGDDAIMGGAYGVLAVACVLSAQAELGIDCAQRAIALLKKTEHRWSLSYAFWALGLCYSQIGMFQEALAAEHESLLVEWRDLKIDDVAALNQQLRQAGLQPVTF